MQLQCNSRPSSSNGVRLLLLMLTGYSRGLKPCMQSRFLQRTIACRNVTKGDVRLATIAGTSHWHSIRVPGMFALLR
jgi:hypothetical protein